MAFERLLVAVPPQPFTADGTTLGQIQIARPWLFKTRQIVLISSTLPLIELQVKRVLDDSIFVGPKDNDLTTRFDVSAYHVSDGAEIQANEQKRPFIVDDQLYTFDDYEHEEEPTNARRCVLVDPAGHLIDSQLLDDGRRALLVFTPGGGGTVNIFGDHGVTATPNPITGTGTLELDLHSLLTGSLELPDEFGFVDVSVGTTPSAQRKATIGDLVTTVSGVLGLGNFLYKPGLPGGQTTFGGTGASDQLNVSANSTAAAGIHFRRIAAGVGGDDGILIGPGADPSSIFAPPGVVNILLTTDNPAGALFSAFGSQGAPSYLGFRSGPGGSVAAPVATTAGSDVLAFQAIGFDSTNAPIFSTPAGAARWTVIGGPFSGYVASTFNLETCDTGGTFASRIFINGTGKVGINNPGPSKQIHVIGDLAAGATGSEFIVDTAGNVFCAGKLTVTGAIDPTDLLFSGRNNAQEAAITTDGDILYNSEIARMRQRYGGSWHTVASLDEVPTVAGHVVQDNGTNETQRGHLNFSHNGGVSVILADDSINDATVVTISGVAGHAIQDDTGYVFPAEPILKFIGPPITDNGGVSTVVDDTQQDVPGPYYVGPDIKSQPQPHYLSGLPTSLVARIGYVDKHIGDRGIYSYIDDFTADFPIVRLGAGNTFLPVNRYTGYWGTTHGDVNAIASPLAYQSGAMLMQSGNSGGPSDGDSFTIWNSTPVFEYHVGQRLWYTCRVSLYYNTGGLDVIGLFRNLDTFFNNPITTWEPSHFVNGDGMGDFSGVRTGMFFMKKPGETDYTFYVVKMIDNVTPPLVTAVPNVTGHDITSTTPLFFPLAFRVLTNGDVVVYSDNNLRGVIPHTDPTLVALDTNTPDMNVLWSQETVTDATFYGLLIDNVLVAAETDADPD